MREYQQQQQQNTSSAFMFNKSEDIQRKASEIPMHTFGAAQRSANAKIQRVSSDDDEDDFTPSRRHQHTLLNNPRLNNAKNDWKVDTSRYTQSLLDDNRIISAKHIAQQISRPIPYTTIFLVILAVFVSGFKGTAFLLVDLSEPIENCENDVCVESLQNGRFVLRALWRQLLMTLFFIPFVYQEYAKEKKEEIEELRLYQREHLLDKKSLAIIVFCAFVYAIWVGTMAYSVFHTSMANAYIFNNIYPLFFVIAKLIPCKSDKSKESTSVNRKEIFGALLAIAVLVMLAGENPTVIISEVIALTGALAASFYQTYLQKIIYNFPWMMAVFLLSLFTSFFFGIYCLAFEQATFDFHAKHGLFGVFNLEWLFLHVFISLLTGVVNVKLFSYISQAIKTVYIDIAIMCEAFAALLLAYIFSQQPLPNLTQCGIYVFYIIALMLLAYGKNDPYLEEIALHDENNLKGYANMVQLENLNGLSKGVPATATGAEQFQGGAGVTSYLPPNALPVSGIPNSNQITSQLKQQAFGGVSQKKNTIQNGFDSQPSMSELYKANQVGLPVFNDMLSGAGLEESTPPRKLDPPSHSQHSANPLQPIQQHEQEEDLNDSIAMFNRNFIKQNVRNKPAGNF